MRWLVKSGRGPGALLLLMLLAAGSSFAGEDEQMKAGPQPKEVADAPPIAKRLWSELVCLCGRCQRLTYSACHCPEATAERKKILEMLHGRDLTTTAGEEAAHAAVLQAYVARFGRTVLASETPSGDWMAWLELAAVPLAIIGAFYIIRSSRVRRPKARRR